jgi:hypothetical protein
MPVVVMKATELRPIFRDIFTSPIEVDRFESVVDVLEETFDASEEIPSFRLASTPST